MRRSAGPVTAELYDPDDVTDLPAPVRRYFETVLQTGHPLAREVRLSQEGDFRLGDADGSWRPFTASQVYSVSPPGYVWDARIELFPFASARVLDAYVDGEGLLRANLLGAIPVASAGPDARMNEAELQRYLSETPWFPTALLPAAGVTWKGIDDRTARASVDDGDVTATATFHFDDDGLITRLTADRYRQEDDTVAPWVGRYGAYEERRGTLIPTEAEVGWITDDGEAPYWRGSITDIEYRTGG
ncbi:DUF6920 family protein [Halosimplex sp. TS25]|uniref:DUF6920 family protein n=1 Tax=Halosimplex rarum TaxID=3396619 RepID=UPI0039E93F4D